jgi:hypothetical protein
VNPTGGEGSGPGPSTPAYRNWGKWGCDRGQRYETAILGGCSRVAGEELTVPPP